MQLSYCQNSKWINLQKVITLAQKSRNLLQSDREGVCRSARTKTVAARPHGWAATIYKLFFN